MKTLQKINKQKVLFRKHCIAATMLLLAIVSTEKSWAQGDLAEVPGGTGTSGESGYTWALALGTRYAIHKTAGWWNAPNYQQLRLGWDTGIILDPGTVYPKSYVDIQGSGLRVTSGNVGIGTTTPQEKLEVNGNARILGNAIVMDNISMGDGIADNSGNGITWFDDNPTAYGIHRTEGGWDAPNYQQLRLGWDTGIILDPGTAHGKSYVDIQGSGLRVTTGNVGIGTATPTAKLDIVGDLKVTGRLRSNSSDGGLWLSNEDNAFVGNFSAEGSFGFWTPASPFALIVNKTTGNVGIGTTTPTAKLDIVGDLKVAGRLISNSSDGLKVSGRLQSDSPDGGLWLSNEDNAFVGNFSAEGSFGFSTPASPFALMVNKTTGNVGIGTHSPTAKLHVNGDTRLQGDIRIDNAVSIGGTNDFSIDATDVVGGRFIVKPDGNVGIGTIDPQSKLAVDGKITTREVEVTANGWSDFVFEEGYALKNLEEVEKYIEKNKHLPDVPSEKEVMKNGLNLGDMDAILLQKIEELTLYMIELKKENKVLAEKVKALEKK